MADNSNTFGTGLIKAMKDDGDDFLNTALRKWKFNSKYIRNQRLFCCLMVFFIVFGSVFLGYYLKIKEVRQRYDDVCTLNKECKIQVEITEDMPQPIFFYYQIDNFFQTHRKFYSSKDILQLRGESRSVSDLTSCSPFVTNKDLGKTKSINGNDLVESDPAIPCGLIAKTYFTDTYTLSNNNGTPVNINEKDIAWDVDIDYNYKTFNGYESKSWANVTDEHFMVWMRTSGMGRFKKLWGRIYDDLPAGSYTLTINNTYDQNEFGGQKSFVMTTSSPFGQKNLVLIIAYYSGAFICAVSMIVLFSLNRSKKDK